MRSSCYITPFLLLLSLLLKGAVVVVVVLQVVGFSDYIKLLFVIHIPFFFSLFSSGKILIISFSRIISPCLDFFSTQKIPDWKSHC